MNELGAVVTGTDGGRWYVQVVLVVVNIVVIADVDLATQLSDSLR